MNPSVFYIPKSTPALDQAGTLLPQEGHIFVPEPGSNVTHLLLGVPCSESDEALQEILAPLPEDVTVVGGNLRQPCLAGYRCLDLLQDPFYVAENASITAHCALKYIVNDLPVVLTGQNVLVIGWGRIAKCLARLLRGLDAEVTVAARKPADRAMAGALGFGCADTVELSSLLPRFRVIVNTAPAPVLDENDVLSCAPGCLKLELASVKGIAGEDVVWARGLPGKDAPESSGALITKTVLRLIS